MADIQELERRIAELERRLREVEARPVYVPYPAPQPNTTQPVDQGPQVQPPYGRWFV